MLAGDLVAQWRASELLVEFPDGQHITEWSDSVAGIRATATGTPTLVGNAIGGRAVVRLDASDGKDAYEVVNRESPLSGADDFSIVVMFSTDSQALQGDENWQDGLGLIHSNQLGFAKDWGISLIASGQIGAGIGGGFGRPSTSVFSTASGYNDGQPHVAVLSRQSDQLSLYVDDHQPVVQVGADAESRGTIPMIFGVDKSRNGELTFDLAEVRVYDGALDAEQVAGVLSELNGFYNNTQPVTVDDQYVATEDELLFVTAADGLLANDEDAESDPLTVETIDLPAHGELSLQADGSFLYAPAADFHGTDVFTYSAVDFRPSNVATVTIVVEPSYDAAVGIDDRYKTQPQRTLSVEGFLGVLANDQNIDELPLTAVLEDDVAFGQLQLNPNGSFAFDPLGTAGQTQFTYRIDDTVGQSDPVTVELISNSSPEASDDHYLLDEDLLRQVSADQGVLANDQDVDGDALQLNLLSSPQHVELALSDDGSMLIVPQGDYFGLDQFTYEVTDGVDRSEVATVTLEIRPMNDPPIASSDAFFVNDSGQLRVMEDNGLLANDLDIDDSTLRVSLLVPPQNGQLQLMENGSFEYQANPGFEGEDVFTYRLSDAAGSTDQGEVTLFVGKAPVTISEFVAANVTSLLTTTRISIDDSFPREDTSPDWIEIQNQTSTELDIAGFYLSDDPENLQRWQFPVGSRIAPNGYLIVFASGWDISDPALDENGLFHTNFKLDAEGDYLALVSPDGDVVDHFESVFPRQLADVSFGWVGDQRMYMPEPSPGADATAGIPGIVDQVDVSLASGYFNEPVNVELTARTAGSLIRYTLDGLEPTLDEGTEYTEPISISSTTILRTRAFRADLLPSTVLTHSYLFLDDVLTQPSTPEGFPDNWGSAGAADYQIDPRIATDTESDFYDPNLRAALQSHPSISLVTETDHLFDRRTGIYSNPQRDGVGWERPASMEYFTSEGQLEVQVNAGLRIQGGASRNPNRPKHNMRLLFKEQYGPGKLTYPVFEESDVDQFDTIILRGGNGDSWFHPNATQQRQAQYIRDQWHRDTQRAMGRMTTDQRYVHLYINGLYWGLYHTFEKPNAAFFAEHFGGEPADFDVLQHQGGTVDGNRDAWNEMMQIARAGLESNEAYEQIEQFVDIPSMVDYLLINYYSGNVDWDQNNWFGGRKREPGGQFRFFTWDAERTFLSTRDNRTGARNSNQPTDLHQRLMTNVEYRLLFADHVHRHFFNDGVLTPDVAQARWESRAEEIQLPLVAESARWGDNKRRSRPYTVEGEWRNELDRLLTTYFPTRTETVLAQLVRRELYPEVIAPTFNQHGGDIPVGFELSMQAADGTIYYTTDGSDPRLVGGAVAASAQIYDTAVVLGGDATVKARVLQDEQWSALNEATFLTPVVQADANSLRISEIHYHPAAPSTEEIAAGFDDSDEFEFIELVNISDQSIDLSQVRLNRVDNQGVDFAFDSGAITRLAPNQRVVVVENQDAFQLRYGDGLPVAGQWRGRLSNGGEAIQLLAGEQSIHQFTYDDTWHEATDGAGPSLEIVEEAHADTARWAIATSWQPSLAIGGTPGRPADDRAIAGDSNHDGRFDSSDLVLVFQIGQYEDGIPQNSTFEDGDWNRNGDFDSTDFVFAFQQGTYVAAARRPAQLDPLMIDWLFGGDA